MPERRPYEYNNNNKKHCQSLDGNSKAKVMHKNLICLTKGKKVSGTEMSAYRNQKLICRNLLALITESSTLAPAELRTPPSISPNFGCLRQQQDVFSIAKKYIYLLNFIYIFIFIYNPNAVSATNFNATLEFSEISCFKGTSENNYFNHMYMPLDSSFSYLLLQKLLQNV